MRLLVFAFVAACGDNARPRVTVVMSVGADPPAYGTTPFPTDALRDGIRLDTITGLERAFEGHTDLIAAQLAALDGFGMRPVVEFFVDGELDPSSIPAATSTFDDAAFLIDIGPASPANGQVVPMDWAYDVERGVIAGAPLPGTVLREGTRYAAVVTTAIRDTDGRPIVRSRALAALGGGVAARWQTTADAHVSLAAQLRDRIAGIAVFTTQRGSAMLVAARSKLATTAVSQPVLAFPDAALIFDTPAKLDALLGQARRHASGPRSGLEEWGGDNPTGLAHAHVGVVATGTLTIARFRGDDTGSDGPGDETFQLGSDGTPRVFAIEPIPVTFVLPRAQPPAEGFPVVIFGHGFGGSRHEALFLAEPLTERGYAVVAIDMWGHGSRFDPADERNNLAGKPGFTGDPSLRDGFGDEVGNAAYLDFFESFLNIGAVRDAMGQSMLDFTRVATLVQSSPDLSALSAPYGAAPRLDTRRVGFLGQSFGTIVGAGVAALEPSVGLYVLDVPGGGLIDQIFTSSATVGALALPFFQTIYRTRGRLDRFHPLLSLLQTIFDGADPLTYAPHVLRDRFAIAGAPVTPRHVVCIEVIGDEILSNPGTTALARALGLDVLEPALDVPPALAGIASPASGNVDGQTGVLVQYAPATHGRNWSMQRGTLIYVPGFPFAGDDPYPKLPAPITIPEPIYETLDQVLEVLDTYRAGMPPRVRSTKAPVRDFDADGQLDDVDPAPHDPSM